VVASRAQDGGGPEGGRAEVGRRAAAVASEDGAAHAARAGRVVRAVGEFAAGHSDRETGGCGTHPRKPHGERQVRPVGTTSRLRVKSLDPSRVGSRRRLQPSFGGHVEAPSSTSIRRSRAASKSKGVSIRAASPGPPLDLTGGSSSLWRIRLGPARRSPLGGARPEWSQEYLVEVSPLVTVTSAAFRGRGEVRIREAMARRSSTSHAASVAGLRHPGPRSEPGTRVVGTDNRKGSRA